jgi:hypothetical protein
LKVIQTVGGFVADGASQDILDFHASLDGSAIPPSQASDLILNLCPDLLYLLHPDVEPRKRDAVKETFNNTLKVIQTVGGFVADGESANGLDNFQRIIKSLLNCISLARLHIWVFGGIEHRR